MMAFSDPGCTAVMYMTSNGHNSIAQIDKSAGQRCQLLTIYNTWKEDPSSEHNYTPLTSPCLCVCPHSPLVRQTVRCTCHILLNIVQLYVAHLHDQLHHQ
jgi:hypothetical protein